MSAKKKFKYNSVAEMFEDIFGKEQAVCKKRFVSKRQQKRNNALQKAVYDYIKQIDEAFEATKGSTLQFD